MFRGFRCRGDHCYIVRFYDHPLADGQVLCACCGAWFRVMSNRVELLRLYSLLSTV